MTTLLSNALQPRLLTLLSSTSEPALSPLFSAHTDPSLPKDSFITHVPDKSLFPAQDDTGRASIPKHATRGDIAHSVIHIQSPTIRTTYIQAGCPLTDLRRRREKGKGREGTLPLGVELEWLGLQIKRLGRREMSFEVGIVDTRGREGVVRCSSFKKNPTVHPHRSPPLIHLPLNLPALLSSTLTPWSDVSINLSSTIQLFQSLPRPQQDVGEDASDVDTQSRNKRKKVELPSGRFASISYIRVYANCRLRRIWLSAEGDKTLQDMGRGAREEWELYAVAGGVMNSL